jgi:hypothetical protein
MINLRIAAYLFILLVILIGCSAKRIVTVEQLNQMVKTHLPIGSSKEQVTAFIESLSIDSLRVNHNDFFRDGARLRYDDFDDEKKNALGDRLKEYYDAAIRDIAPSTGTFEANIKMRFYFDENGKLLDYTIKEETAFR